MAQNKHADLVSNAGVQHIRDGESLLAIILRSGFAEPGIHFLTPNDFSQQLAFMRHPPGKHIVPHTHNPVRREVTYTQEVLILRRGKLRADFYRADQSYLYSVLLHAGDVILLASGGHGFEVIEEAEFIEVKQGPYAGDHDKTRFSEVEASQVRLVDES